MQDLERVYNALRKADAAGNYEDAKKLADYIRSVSQKPVEEAKTEELDIPITPEKAGIARRVGDVGLGLAQGVIGLPEALVGVADIPTGGAVGKALEGAGVKFKEAKDILQSYKSPEQQAAEQYVGEGEGFFGTVGRAIERPSVIAGTIAESIPSMLGGAAIGRGILAAAPKIAPVLPGAIGEGIISAGSSAENIRQQTGDLTAKQSAIAATSGVLTGALGVFGGKVASRLGVDDFDTLAATGVSQAEKGSIIASAIKGALSESVFEELPQSMQEQVANNLAMDKPWDEGVAEAGAMGVLAAIPMGGGASALGQYRANAAAGKAKDKEDEETKQDVLDQDTRLAAESLGINLEDQYADTDIEGDTGDGETRNISGATGEGVSVPSQAGVDEVTGGPEVADTGRLGGAGRDVAGVGGTESTVNAPLVNPSAQQLQEAPVGARFIINGVLHEKDDVAVRPVKTAFNEAELQEEQALEPYATKNLGKPIEEQKLSLEKEQARLARVKEIKEQIKADKAATEAEGKARLEAADIAERQRKQRLYNTAPKIEPDYKSVANELYRYEKAETDKDFNELPKSQQNLEAKTVGLYEANRKTAAKEMNIELPDWGRLSQDARQEFKSQIQQGKKVDSLGLASAFDKVATQLEAENVAFREFGPTEVNRLQTKVQEKSSLDYAQREQAVDRVLQEGRQNTWGEILDILSPVQETVPGQARVTTATPAIAEKIKEVMNRIGGDVNIAYGTMNDVEIAEGRYAKFDPKTNTITIDRNAVANNDKSLSSSVTHEMVHYLMDHLVDNPNKATPQQKVAIKKLDNLRKNLLKVHSSILKGKELGAEYDIGTLKEFIAELMSNDGFKRDLAGLTVIDPAQVSKKDEDNVAKKNLFKYILSESSNNRGKSVLNVFFQKIADLLGFNTKNAKVLEYAVNQLEYILNDEAYTPPSQAVRGETVSYATKKAGQTKQAENEPKPETYQQLENKAYNNVPEVPKSLVSREIKWLFTEKAKLWTFRELQNDRYYLKDWQNKLEKMGKLVVGDKGYNDVYNFVTNAFGKAQKLSIQYLQQPSKELNEALNKYAEYLDLDSRTATARAGLYAEAKHETETRREKYLRIVPLSVTKKVINPITKKLEPAADVRVAIYNELKTNLNLTKNEAEDYHKELIKIVENNKEKGGTSYDTVKSKLDLDINSSDYTVCHLTPNDVNTVINKINEDPKEVELLAEVLKALKKLNDAAIKLNQEAGYWTPQVQNFKNFYGYEFYVPYKGRPNLKLKNDDDSFGSFDPNTMMLSTELKQTVGMAQGRTSESQNPILQTLVDATSAAARAGRGYEYTQAIKNAIAPPEGQDKVMSGKILKTLSFEERADMSKENEALLNKRNVILHYDPNGSIDIIEIDNAELLEAIRRPYKGSTNFLFEELNKLTSFFGQMHTRYNPSFPVLNYARDVLTNAYIMMAEGDPKMAARFAGAAAKNTLNLPKAGLIAKYYHSGNFEAIKQMTKKDKFAADMLEYIEEGGRVAYAQSLSVQSGIAELHKGIGRNGVLKTKEKIDKLFDVWTDAFELTARVSAYGLVRDNNLAKGMSEKAAKRVATSHVKQYANFEEVGRLGKELGAMFMFFRPAMTGAVRSIEALAPALPGSLERFMNSLPKGIDEQARETARKNFERQQRAARVAAGSLAAAGAAVYAMAAMLSGSDDEERNRVLTDDMSRWTRFARFDLGEDRVLQLPWGFGLGALPAAGAQVASMFSSYSDPLDTVGNLVQIGLDSFLPLPVSRMNPFDNFTAFLIDSITPSAVRPLYELTMNVNSFGYEIYNNRQTRISDAYIGGDNIPELYKEAAKLIYDATDGAISWSPNTMYFLMNNYVDGVSRMAHNGYGTMLTLTGEKEFDAKTDVPLFESFLSKQSNIDNRRYGELQKEITNLRQRLQTMQERNPEALDRFLEKNPSALAAVEIFDKMTGSVLNDLREEANTIRYKIPDLSLKEKKEMLKDNLQLQSAIKRNIVENIEAIREIED